MVRRTLVIFALISALFSASHAAFAVNVPDCTSLARAAEKAHGLPDGILQSISIVEAARIQPDGTYKAWPWTLNDAGKGLFFDSAKEVIAYLDAHMVHPDTSIDVGCMQINTKWHGAFFETFDEMLDPESNVAYAAGFLTDLYYAHGSWEDAIRHYHSSETHRNAPYLDRVMSTWTRHYPDSQTANIETAVYQVPLEPLNTASDDAFARALAEAKQPPKLPAAQPITLPLAKPSRAKTTGAMAGNPHLPAKPVQRSAGRRIPVAAQVEATVSKPPSIPVDPDADLKRRQKYLAPQWDRVLMFRAALAGNR